MQCFAQEEGNCIHFSKILPWVSEGKAQPLLKDVLAEEQLNEVSWFV
jgi:hypothetical protein